MSEKIKYGLCRYHGWVIFHSSLYASCPLCNSPFLEEISASSVPGTKWHREKWEAYKRIFLKTTGAEETSIDPFLFRLNFRNAVLVGVCSQNSYFPIDSSSAINIRYDPYLGLDKKMRRILAEREWVYLRPFDISYWDLETVCIQLVKELCEKGLEPKRLIITFTGGEDFYGLMASFILRSLGYLVFPEGALHIPVYGVPDIIAVKLKAQQELVKRQIIEKGAFLAELELFDTLPPAKTIAEEFLEREESVAIEVEPEKLRASSGRSQLSSYAQSACFNKAYLACPDRVEDEAVGGFGLITWRESGDPVIYHPNKDWGGEKVKITLDQAKRTAMQTFLRNVKPSKLIEEYGDRPIAEIIENAI